MIGFFNTTNAFSLAAIQALQEQANTLYINNSPDTYPTGGIPSGEGNGIYTYTGSLTSYDPPLDDSSIYYHHILSATDAILTIESKYCSEPLSSTTAKIAVLGTIGANQTLIVRGCKFEDIDSRGMYIKGVDNIIIEGNYFDYVKKPFSIIWAKNITIRYNKIKNHAMGGPPDLAGSHAFAINGGSVDYNYTVDSLNVSYNLVDRSDADYTGKDLTSGSQDRIDTALASDYINFRQLVMTEGSTAQVFNNIELGSEWLGETATGCGFIVDDACSGFQFSRNVSVNCTQSSYGSANSTGTWTENIGHFTAKADYNITAPNTGIISSYLSRCFNMTYYSGGGDCSAVTADTVAGPHYLYGNRARRTGQEGQGHIGPIQSEIIDGVNGIITQAEATLKVDGSNTFNIISGNSFGWRTDNPTYPKLIGPYYAGTSCEYSIMSYYLDLYNTVDVNPPAVTTDNEVFQLMCDMDYVSVTNGMRTNNAMFDKWGTADNHSMYFDESRAI